MSYWCTESDRWCDAKVETDDVGNERVTAEIVRVSYKYGIPDTYIAISKGSARYPHMHVPYNIPQKVIERLVKQINGESDGS